MSKKCTPLWREAHFEVKSVKKLAVSDHFWKLRCRKSARRCGAKHISKSKCTKHTMLAPLLEVRMLKKCTRLWREAHFEVKSVKTGGFEPFLTLRCRVKLLSLLLILEGNKRFHYTISGVECNKRFTRTIQCGKRFFRLFGENLVNSPGFHQVFTRFCKFTRILSVFNKTRSKFNQFTKFSPSCLKKSPGFHQVTKF